MTKRTNIEYKEISKGFIDWYAPIKNFDKRDNELRHIEQNEEIIQKEIQEEVRI